MIENDIKAICGEYYYLNYAAAKTYAFKELMEAQGCKQRPNGRGALRCA